SWYDASQGRVFAGSCSGVDGFSSSTDLYGCCDNIEDADTSGWEARIDDVDGTGNQSGDVYVRVRADQNEVPDGCSGYGLTIGF
ncbi:MAG: hypothetical protein KC561_02425, partial [Myxococcales bacterium]|nr:hypothetical protein [Myxococcales bacterium]